MFIYSYLVDIASLGLCEPSAYALSQLLDIESVLTHLLRMQQFNMDTLKAGILDRKIELKKNLTVKNDNRKSIINPSPVRLRFSC